jgi:cysteine-rich repeat protein
MVGQVACQGSALAQRLACDGMKWQAGTTCASGQLCDSTTGECGTIVPECATATPGQVVCRTGDIPLTCGPDLVTATEGTACVGLCMAGVCEDPTCSDGKVEPGEQCDDKNTVATDACTATCQNAVCGDGIIWAGKEQCDDKNKTAGDGCGPTCAWEPIFASGYQHTCAIGKNGVLKCWGNNANGELGLGDVAMRGDGAGEMGAALPAVQLGTGRTVTFVGAMLHSTCAFLDNAAVKCWGYSGAGEGGLGDTNTRGDNAGEMGDALPAVSLGTGRTVRTLGVGSEHACVLLDNGAVKCWGFNSFGQLGQGNTNNLGDEPNEMGDNLLAVDLGTGHTVKSLAVGKFHNCAILDDNTLKCWGSNNNGELGLGDTDSRGQTFNQMGDSLPVVNLGTGRTAKSVVAGYFNTCAILDDNSLKCWGDIQAAGIVSLGTGRTAKSVVLGFEMACALLDNNTVKCWGTGPLGYGDPNARGTAAQMGDALPAIDLGTGQVAKQINALYHGACALLASGSLKCWGANDHAELGLGDLATRGDAAGEMGDQLPPVNLVF